MTYDYTIAAWACLDYPTIACCFVPVVAKKSDKARNYFVIAIMAVVCRLGVFNGARRLFGNGQAESDSCPGSQILTQEYTLTLFQYYLPV